MKIELTIPDGVELPAEFIGATLRQLIHGENVNVLAPDGGRLQVVDSIGRTVSPQAFHIVLDVWQWPAFIRPGWWIAMDADGMWRASVAEPQLQENRMWVDSGGYSGVNISCFNWTPPPCDDYRKSKMQKPLE